MKGRKKLIAKGQENREWKGMLVDLLDSAVPIPAESDIGGKAVSLMRLSREGFRICGGFALTAAFAARFLQRSGIDPLSENAAEQIQCTPFDAWEAELLTNVWRRTGKGGCVIVRSSAPGEDCANASFAGIYESVPNVGSPQQLTDAIKRVWMSYLSPQAKLYREAAGNSAALQSMPVLIQEMLDCETAGVLFTRHPVTGEDCFVAEISREGCRQVVDGEGAVQRFTWRRGSEIEEAPDNGFPAAKDASLLMHTAEHIAACLGDAWDVEWGILQGTLYVFQARPITSAGAGKYHDISSGGLDCVLLDRFAAPASVCYLSLLDAWQDRVYLSFYSRETGGAPEDKPLCFLRNRVYWNLKFQKKYFEDTGKGDNRKRQRLLREMERGWRSWYRRLRTYRRRIRSLSRRLSGSIGSEALLTLLDRVTENFCDGIGVDHFRFLGFAQISYKWARAACREAGVDESEADAVMARWGQKSRTVRANRELMRLARRISGDTALRSLFLNGEPSEIWSRLQSDPYAAVRGSVDAYLKKHGHRAMHCDDLLYPHLKEEPEYLLTVLQQYLRRLTPPTFGTDQKARSVSGVPAASDAELSREMQRKLKCMTRLAGIYMRLREDQRYEFDRSWVLLRRILLKLGEQLVGEQFLERREDIFHLTIEEIRRCTSGQLQNAAQLALQRRRLFDLEKERTPPYLFKESEQIELQLKHSRRYKAVGISGGEARSRVRLLRGPEDFDKLQGGEIGVVHTFHPSWTPLLKLVSGLIMSYGNMLSHGAVVAREYRIPVVVFNGDAMRSFSDGDLVELNGTTGRIRVLERNTDAGRDGCSAEGPPV